MTRLRRVPVVVLGPGGVGGALLRRIVETRERLADAYGLRLAVVAVADSRATVVAAPGGELGDAALSALVAHKTDGGALAAWSGARRPAAGTGQGHDARQAPIGVHGPEAWLRLSGPGDSGARGTAASSEAAAAAADAATPTGFTPIVVDTTAADTGALLRAARARGARLVLANKRPLTGELATFEALTRGGAGARWETTVAAALPVVAALQAVLDAGDTVDRIRGTLSGTLGYVVERLEGGQPFSAAVREAVERGYAEPDPRADLSGRDVARKALILARMTGARIELADVALRGLYPPSWEGLSVEAFLARLPERDAALRDRADAAQAAGRALRFVTTVDTDAVRSGLETVGRDAPLGQVAAGDSAVVIETALYRAHPLVVSGRGGGPAFTAAGVLADVVALASCGAARSP